MRLSNITLKTQIQVKEQCFYGCSAFNSHSGIYNNEQNSYPKMSVKNVRHLLPDKTFIHCSNIGVYMYIH